MKVSVKDNLKEVNKWTTNVQKKQVPFATAMAINKTLGIGKGKRMKGLDRAMQKQMIKKLDRPMKRTTTAFYRIAELSHIRRFYNTKRTKPRTTLSHRPS